jgi:hypothetical protein
VEGVIAVLSGRGILSQPVELKPLGETEPRKRMILDKAQMWRL